MNWSMDPRFDSKRGILSQDLSLGSGYRRDCADGSRACRESCGSYAEWHDGLGRVL